MEYLVSLIGLFFGLMSFSSAHAELVPALKYKGQILGGSGPARSCEFYVAFEPSLDPLSSEFALVYTALLHGQNIPAGLAEFYYFDPAAALGSNFYTVDQPQDQSALTMSSIVLRPTSPKFGTEVTPNDIPVLNQNRDIQTSIILNFKSGISFEDYTDAFAALAEDPNSALDPFVLDSVDLMTILLWDAGHYDRVRCGNASFDSMSMVDVDFQNDQDVHDTEKEEHDDEHDDDHSDHDH